MTSDKNRALDYEAAIFAWLNRKYVQDADDRQKAMGLQYTTAETHDLAKGLAALIARAEDRPSPEPTEICWRCSGEGCIQEGSPEAWNYADCPECGGKRALSAPSPERDPALYACEVSDLLDAIDERQNAPGEEWSISLSAGHWRCIAAHLRGFTPSPERAEGAPAAEGKEDVRSVRQWLLGLHGLDMDEIAADGGITVGMVVQQQAVEMAGRLGRYLSHPAPAAEPVAWRILDQFGTALALCALKPSDLIVGETLQPLYASPPPEPVAISREDVDALVEQMIQRQPPTEYSYRPETAAAERTRRLKYARTIGRRVADAILAKLSSPGEEG